MELVFKQGLEFCKKGEYQQAIVLFNKVIDSQPDHQASIHNRAKANTKLLRLQDALSDYDILIHLAPTNADYFSDRGILYFHLKDNKKAIADLDKACGLQPEKSYRYSSRAFLKERIGNLEDALLDYSEAIRLDPEDAISINNKGMAEEKLGRIQQANDSFKIADSILGIDNQSYPIPPIVDETDNGTLKSQNKKADIKKEKTGDSYSNTFMKLLTSKESRIEFYRFVIDLFSSKKS